MIVGKPLFLQAVCYLCTFVERSDLETKGWCRFSVCLSQKKPNSEQKVERTCQREWKRRPKKQSESQVKTQVCKC